MARQARGPEHVQVTAQYAGPQNVDFGHAEPGDDGLVSPQLPPVYAHGHAPVQADATARNPKLSEEQLATVPDRKRFRVMNSTVVSGSPGPGIFVQIKVGHTTQRAFLRMGKEIDDANYDIRELQKQGVKLQRVVPGEGIDESFMVD